MSAILEGAPFLNTLDGRIRQYKTKIKVVVHSHNSSTPIYLSDDVFSCQISKTVKGPGQLNLGLVPRKNLLNIIFPNDLINVYFDVDGKGWTRTFFGFVDRMEESYDVSEEGTPTTLYYLIATDFTKVIEKTEIYFNPHIARRSDFDGTFLGTSNLGGIAMMTNGVRAYGSPDEMVTNLIMILLGFGTQFTVPQSYPVPVAIIKEARRDRQRAALRLIQNSITPEQYIALRDKIEHEADTDAATLLQNGSNEAIATELTQQYGVDPSLINVEAIRRLQPDAQQEAVSTLIVQARFQQALGVNTGLGSNYAILRGIMDRTESSARPSFLDYLDIFNFVEREAMDGRIQTTSVWQQQGSLLSLITEFSNEIVNEMFFDLRPKSLVDENDQIIPEAYDTSPDDVKENMDGGKTSIHYVPALVMREYPFSTIQNLDASQVPITIGQQQFIGDIPFGAIFSNEPNRPGRHVVEIENINWADKVNGTGPATGKKIMDVAVICQQEITSSKLGRSDVDHVNLIELWSSNGILGDDAKYFMQDLLPIVTPVHIMRHGLRRRSLTTRFAAFDIPTAQAVAGTTQPAALPTSTVPEAIEIDVPPITQEEIQASIGPEDSVDITGQISTIAGAGSVAAAGAGSIASVLADNQGSLGIPVTTQTVTTPSIEDAIPTGSLIWPVQLPGNERRIPRGPGKFGYRRWTNNHGKKFFGAPTYAEDSTGEAPGTTEPGTYYSYHQGLDIQADAGTAVVAAADGMVVASAPPGTFRNYGAVVIIKTNLSVLGKPIYLLYAHLNKRTPQGGGNQNSTVFEDAVSTEFKANSRAARNGRFTPIPVRAGDQIGEVGNTTGIKRDGTVERRVGPHLHFETILQYPSVNRIQVPNISGDAPQSLITQLEATQVQRSINPEPLFIGARTRTSAVVLPYEEVDVSDTVDDGDDDIRAGGTVQDLLPLNVDEITAAQGYIPEAGISPDVVAAATNAVPNPNLQPEGGVATTEEQTAPANNNATQGSVDNVSTRKTLARWALLQDHWYQHNLEYVSGSIAMRPAPEIRVGYRLDIYDRDMSFYVEGVSHSWQFPGTMSSSLSVTRGQPNNPYPVYIHPRTDGFSPSDDQRRENSRLAKYFIIPDPIAVKRALVLRNSNQENSSMDEFITPNSNTIDDRNNVIPYERGTLADSVGIPPSSSTIDASVTDAINAAAAELQGVTQSVIDNAPSTLGSTVGGTVNLPRGT